MRAQRRPDLVEIFQATLAIIVMQFAVDRSAEFSQFAADRRFLQRVCTASSDQRRICRVGGVRPLLQVALFTAEDDEQDAAGESGRLHAPQHHGSVVSLQRETKDPKVCFMIFCRIAGSSFAKFALGYSASNTFHAAVQFPVRA